MLVRAIIREGTGTGTNGSSYLQVRNKLQTAPYLGRALMQEEKDTVGELLKELQHENRKATNEDQKERAGETVVCGGACP